MGNYDLENQNIII